MLCDVLLITRNEKYLHLFTVFLSCSVAKQVIKMRIFINASFRFIVFLDVELS